MRFRYMFVFYLILVLFLASCASLDQQDEVDVSASESQLNSSLNQIFDYYYSMSLLDFQEVIEFVSLLDSEKSKEKQYIIGRIDSILNYTEYYLYNVRIYQNHLQTSILPESLIPQIETLNIAKRDYLSLLSQTLKTDSSFNADFLSKNKDIRDRLKELNIEIGALTEEQVREYSQQLDGVSTLISEVTIVLN